MLTVYLATFQEVVKGLGENGGTRVAIGLWPFTTFMFDNTTDSAFPLVRGEPNCPIMVYFTWEGEHNDDYWIGTMKKILATLTDKVQNPESKKLPYFINTALCEDTTVEDLYHDSLPRLKEVTKKYDPKRVMDRTGGFRIPLA